MLPNSMKIKILFILDKQKLIGHMEKDSAIIKTRKRSLWDSLKTGNLKVWENSILQVEIITSVSLNLTKKMEEAYINGLEKSRIYMKDSL